MCMLTYIFCIFSDQFYNISYSEGDSEINVLFLFSISDYFKTQFRYIKHGIGKNSLVL